jgi:hypothetical protein
MHMKLLKIIECISKEQVIFNISVLFFGSQLKPDQSLSEKLSSTRL